MRQNFIYPEIKETDYTFGSKQIVGSILRPDGDWRPYLPPEEIQRRNGVESSACFIEASQHALATILEEEFNIPDQNFSARFNLIFASATPQGGDPLKGAQSFRDKGLVPDTMLPFSDIIKSWEEFRSFLGGDRNLCESQGRTWRRMWNPKYDIVFKKEDSLESKFAKLKEALKYSPVPISVYGVEENGTYIKKPKGVNDTHLVEAVYVDKDNKITVFDTYPPFVKVLPANYNSDFGMRFTLEKETTKQQISIIQQLIELLQKLLGLKKQEEVPPPPSKPLETPVLPPLQALKWDTKENARHSVRVLCDMEGLDVPSKNIITAVIACESGFNTKAVNKNNDARKSTDYGICQYNSYWYIGEGKPITSIDEALNNPEKCVRVMINQFKKGRLKDWVCYSSGKFVNYF